MFENLFNRGSSLFDKYIWIAFGFVICIFLGLFLSLQAGFYCLVFLVLAGWVWNNESVGIYLFIFLASFLPMFKITQTIGTVTLLKDVIILALFMKMVVLPIFSKKLPYRRNILLVPIVALIVWLGIGILRADEILLGILRARDILMFVLLFFVILYLPISKKIIVHGLRWIFIVTLGLMTLGIYQLMFATDGMVQRFDPARSIWILRMSSILAHPSIFGEFLIIVALLLASLAFWMKKHRAFYGLFFIALLPFIFLTYSRAVWIGFVAGIGVMVLSILSFLIIRRVKGRIDWRRAGTSIAGLIILVSIVVTFSPAGTIIRTAFDPTYRSNEERLEFLARLVAPMSNIEALIGRGLGDVLAQNFRKIDLTSIDIAAGASREVQLAKNATLVDNQYLKTWVELGFVGLVIYFWIGIVIYRQSIILVLKGRDKIRKVIGLWSLGFITAFAIQGFFIDIWEIFPTNAYFWIIVALVSVLSLPIKISNIKKNLP